MHVKMLNTVSGTWWVPNKLELSLLMANTCQDKAKTEQKLAIKVVKVKLGKILNAWPGSLDFFFMESINIFKEGILYIYSQY